MPIAEALLVSLSISVAKFLFKKYLGKDGQIVGEHGEVLHDEGILGEAGDVAFAALADIGKDQIKDALNRRRAARAFEDAAEKIIRQIKEQLFEEENENPTVDANAIAEQLQLTLDSNLNANFLITNDLSPSKVAQSMRSARPLPKGSLNSQSDLLYEQTLDHLVRGIVEIASLLPKFQPAVIAEQLSRLSKIGDSVDKVLQQLRHVETQVAKLSSEQGQQQYELDYRQAIAANLDFIELFGVDLPEEFKRFQLTDAFVSLNVQSENLGLVRDDCTNASDGEDGDTEMVSCESLFNSLSPKTGRLLIRGPAGSGKTTLMRWAAIQAATLQSAMNDFENPDATIQRMLLDAEDFREKINVQSKKKFHVFFEICHSASISPDVKAEKNVVHSIAWKNVIGTHAPLPAQDEWEEFLKTKAKFDWQNRVPFLIPLRRCEGGAIPNSEDFPQLIGQGIGTPPTDWVRNVMKNGRALILIDGIDEVPPDQRSEVFKGLHSLVKLYPNCYFIITTRPEAVPINWLSELSFREATINPMPSNDVRKFVRKWHELAERKIAAFDEPVDLKSQADGLLEQLDETHSLRTLATNPLLCAILCALHHDRRGKLPETQTEICNALCDMFLHRREEEQSDLNLGSFPKAYRALLPAQKRTLIQDLAVHMVRERKSTLALSVAIELVGLRLRGFREANEADASAVMRGLLERSGILREPVPQQVDFLHNTLKEFLAGEYFAREHTISPLVENSLDPDPAAAEQWKRVALFAVGSRDASEFYLREFVEKVLGPPDPNSGSNSSPKSKRRSRRSILSDPDRRRQIFALQCQVAADNRGLPDLKQRLVELTASLFPPRTLSDAESLAVMRDQAVPYLKHRPRMTAKASSCNIRCLRLIGTPLAMRTLKEYYHRKEEVVLSELAQAVNPLLLPEVIQRISERNSSILSENVSKQISDLAPLSGLSSLEYLSLNGTSVSDLAPLSSLNSLQTLSLDGTSVSDLAPLSGLNSLQTLSLDGTSVSDLASLSGLNSLQTLSLNGTSVSDLTPLSSLNSLQGLYLNSTSVSDLAPLSGLNSLRTLYLNGASVSDLAPLSCLNSLIFLNLNGTPVSDLAPLSGLKSLHTLSLNGTPVSDLSPLSGLNSLQGLYLNSTSVADLSPLSGLNSLRTLYMNGASISDLAPLSSLNALQTLSLDDTSISDLAPLSCLNSLGYLSLDGTLVSDLAPLSSLNSLMYLYLFGTSVSDFTTLKGLHKLSIFGVENGLPS